MKKYYYIGTFLPNLSFDTPPEISFAELKELLKDNLTPSDYEKTIIIRRFFDLLNLRSFWSGEEFDPFGELTLYELGESLINRSGFPEYVYEFLETYPGKEERLRHFSFLLAKFFQGAADLKDPFLRRYMLFERDLRLITAAFRAKKLNRDLSYEFRYENPEEELIAQLSAFRDGKNFELPEKYTELKLLFDRFSDDPLALQKAIDEYRFNSIDALVDMSDTFSIERILAYLAQLIIVQKWFEMDKAKGIRIVETLVKEI